MPKPTDTTVASLADFSIRHLVMVAFVLCRRGWCSHVLLTCAPAVRFLAVFYSLQ